MIAMMPQVQLRSFCSEEVWHPRWEVLRKFLSMAQVVESQGLPKQNDLRWTFQSRYWILFSLAHFLSRSLLWTFLIPVINLFELSTPDTMTTATGLSGHGREAPTVEEIEEKIALARSCHLGWQVDEGFVLNFDQNIVHRGYCQFIP